VSQCAQRNTRAHRSAIDADCADRGNGAAAVASDFRRGHFRRDKLVQRTCPLSGGEADMDYCSGNV
jgi:hypothetical protein